MESETQTRGVIQRGIAYPLPVFKQLTGLERKSIARLRHAGMPVRKAGRNCFILGDDFLEALRREK